MLSENTIKKGLRYCCQDISLIENYKEAVKSDKRYVCHHKLGIDVPREELIEKGLYYNRPAQELIFVTISEHTRLHKKGKYIGEKNPMYGRHHTEESKKKMSEILSDGRMAGAKNPRYGKHLSAETKQKISNIHKGKKLSNETKQKISDVTKGKNNPRAKQCIINGISYGCLKDAQKALYPNMPYSTFCGKYNKGDLN